MYSKLKILMQEKKLTVEKVAQVLGVHRNTLHNKLSGKKAFTITELQKIRNDFFPEKTLDELLGGIN